MKNKKQLTIILLALVAFSLLPAAAFLQSREEQEFSDIEQPVQVVDPEETSSTDVFQGKE